MIEAKAVRIEGAGDAEVLELGTSRVRDPGPGELRVEVAAAGLNRADILQRRGFYPAPPGAPTDVPGLEYAGTVESCGEGVQGFRTGDRVMGIVAGGGMCTHVVVHEREAIPVPQGLELTDAAAVPEVFLTAYDALFLQGELRLGQTVLLHAVASGIGTAALQLCLATGAHPIGTSRSDAKLERCKQLGLREALKVEEGRFAKALQARAEGRAPGLILDTIGAAYLKENLKAVASEGRIVVIGLMGGATGELPMGLLLAKRVTLRGSVLRSRPLEEKAALTQAFMRDVSPLLEAGKVRPVVDSIMPMADVREAHGKMERNETFGKIVLCWS